MWKLITTRPFFFLSLLFFSFMPFPKYSWRLLYLSISISRNLQQKQYKTGPLDHTDSGEKKKKKKGAQPTGLYSGQSFSLTIQTLPQSIC
jgi:hypothetical protein